MDTDNPIRDFNKINEMSPKPKRSVNPDDRARDIEGALDWMRNIDSFTCTITNEDENEFPSVFVNTSGDVDLNLQDKYGVLEFESCDDVDCIVPITYTYIFPVSTAKSEGPSS